MKLFVERLLWTARAARTWRWLALAVAVAVAVLGALATSLLPNRYEAVGRIYVDTQTALKPLMAGLTYTYDFDQQIRLLASTLVSRPNVEALVDAQKLGADPALSGRSREQIVAELMREIRVKPTTVPNLYDISYRGPTPAFARRIVEATFAAFGDASSGAAHRNAQEADRFVETQLRDYAAQLTQAEQRLAQFKQQHFGSSGVPSGDHYARLATLTQEVAKLQVDANAAARARDAYRAELARGEPALPAEIAPRDAGTPAQESQARLDAERRRLADLLGRFTETHPEVLAAQRTVARMEAEARGLAEVETRALERFGKAGKAATSGIYRPFYQQLRIDLADAEARAASLQSELQMKQAQLARDRDAANRMPQLQGELAQLTRDEQVARNRYDQMLSRREFASLGVKLDEAAQRAELRIVEPPQASGWPAFPGRLHAALLLVLLVPALGIAAACLAEALRPTLVDPDGLQQITSLPVIGSVSHALGPTARQHERRLASAFALALAVALALQGVWIARYIVVPITQAAETSAVVSSRPPAPGAAGT